jgi:MFS family permease
MSGAPLLRNTRFVYLWAGQGASFIGDAVSMVAVVVLVAELTGSASAVGGVLLAQLLPTLASPAFGVLADRLDRRMVLVACDLLRAALVAALIFAESLPVVYVLVFLLGAARTLFNPTVRAAFPSVVGESDLTRANSLISGTFSTSIMVGPALGGVLVASVGVEAAFALDAATFLLSAALLSRIPLPRPQREGQGAFARELRAGLSYLAGSRVPLAIVAGAFLTVVTANATVPAEIFLARDVFGAGNVGYGLLAACWGGGMVVGSALVAVVGEYVRLMPIYILSIFVTALAFGGVAFAPTFVFALGAVTLAGAANGVDNVATDTVLQKRVPDALLGRVFSVRYMAFSAGEATAYPVGGLIVDFAGPQTTYLLAGVATAAAGLLVLVVLAGAPRRDLYQP